MTGIALVAVPISPAQASTDLQFILRDSEAKVIVYDESAESIVSSIDLEGAIPIAAVGRAPQTDDRPGSIQ